MAAKKNQDIEEYRFLSITDIAMRTSMHYKTIAKYIQKKKLKSVKVGGKRLVPINEFMRFVNAEDNF